MTVSAVAGPVHVATADLEDTFGSVVGGPLLVTTSGADWSLNIEATVRFKNGVYTYLYEISDAPPPESAITILIIGSPLFDPTMSYGTAGDNSCCLADAIFTSSITFHLNPALTNQTGDTLILYAQSTSTSGDVPFIATGTEGSSGQGDTIGPVATPEPGTLLLLGSGLLGTGLFAKKKLL